MGKNNLAGIILAAGKGSRTKLKSPKGLIKYKNKSLISHVIQSFKKNKIENINIITGYKKDFFERKLNENFLNNKRWKNTNMFYSLSIADRVLKNNYCIISYADIFYEKKAISLLLKKKYDISITSFSGWKKLWSLRFKKPLEDLESFKIDKKNNLIKIATKERKIKEIQGQYMGLIGLSPKGWMIIKKSLKNLSKHEIEKISLTEVFKRVLINYKSIKVLDYKNKFFEIDFKKDLRLKYKF